MEQIGQLLLFRQAIDAELEVLFLFAGRLDRFDAGRLGRGRLEALLRVTLAVTYELPISDVRQIGDTESVAIGVASVGDVDVVRCPSWAARLDKFQQVAPTNRRLAAAVEDGDHQQQQHAEAEHVPNEVATPLRRGFFVGGLVARGLRFVIFIHRWDSVEDVAMASNWEGRGPSSMPGGDRLRRSPASCFANSIVGVEGRKNNESQPRGVPQGASVPLAESGRAS